MLKELLDGSRILKALALIFQVRGLQSVLIFSIHPCSFMVFIISLVFFYLSELVFSGFLQFKDNFVPGQNNFKYRD